MFYPNLHSDPYRNPQQLKNGYVYNIKPFKNKIQLIEQPTPEDIAEPVSTSKIRDICSRSIDKIRLFVDEYMVGKGKYSWFWFLILFIFCILLVCFVVRIQMKLDFIASKLIDSGGVYKLVKQ